MIPIRHSVVRRRQKNACYGDLAPNDSSSEAKCDS